MLGKPYGECYNNNISFNMFYSLHVKQYFNVGFLIEALKLLNCYVFVEM